MNTTDGQQDTNSPELDVATLGGGCFWCLEPIFKDLRGVVSAESGYSGGRRPNPTYEQVSTGTTGHAEVVQVTFDPKQISYRDLLRIFFTFHDPTTLNRQGADVGTQYRSVVLYHSPEQKAATEEVIRELDREGVWGKPIVTQIVPFEAFYRAEDYHQDYFLNNPGQGYCRVVIAPKVTKFRKQYADMLKREPAQT